MFCKTVNFCLQLLEFIILSTMLICMSHTGGILGNSFNWKLGSPELNNLKSPLKSETLQRVSLKVVFSCKLVGGSHNLIIFYSLIGKESRTYNIVFLIY